MASRLENVKKIPGLVKQAGAEWMEDDALSLSAAVSYYTVFSLPALLFLVIAIASQFLNRAAVQGELVNQIGGMIGGKSAELLQTMIANASQSGGGMIATIIGLATLIIGASAVFAQLQQSMNTIWNIKMKPGASFKYTILKRLFSFSMILVIGFLLLVSLVISTAISAFGDMLNQFWPGPPIIQYLMQAVNLLVSFGVVTALFALIFKILPDAKIAWKDVWLGAAVSALLFTIGKLLIGLYLAKSAMVSTYGAAGSLVLMLAWIYYSSMILFFGAELTQVYANKYGSHIVPKNYAEPAEKKAA